MQTTGYMIVKGETILVLCRQKKYTRTFKIRKSGKEGQNFPDDAAYLATRPELLQKLKTGQTIEI